MIRNTQAVWPALGAVLLGVTLAGCGSNTADNTATTTTDTTTSTSAPSTTADTTTNAASTGTGGAPTGNGSNGTGAAGTTVTGKASASFAGAAATWKQVTAANAALDKVIKSKKLKTVHEAAFKVRDLVKMLPAKSSGLPADKQKTLAAQVKNVAQLAAKLDEAGDSGKLKETQENQAGMNDALDIIKGLYPAGALK